jgi:hypothetical protein
VQLKRNRGEAVSRRQAGTRRSKGLRRGMIPCALAASIAAMLLLAGNAAARTVRPFTYSGTSFDGTGLEIGTFGTIQGIRVDEANRNVYTLDQKSTGEGTGRVSRFSMTGVPDSFSGLPKDYIFPGPPSVSDGHNALVVDNSPGSSGNFYVIPASGGPIRAYGRDGVEKTGGFPLTSVGASCGAAVDPQGNLWYADSSQSKLIEVDGETGVPTGEKIAPGFNACKVAIDAAGNFYTSERTGSADSSPVRKLDPEGNMLYDLDVEEAFQAVDDIAVDPVSGRVFVAFGNFVSQGGGKTVYVFEPNSPDVSFEFELGTGARNLAPDGVTHDLYIPQNGSPSTVQIWNQGAPTIVPDVTTEPPVVTPVSATLHGLLNPDGVETTECFFQWGTTTSYGNTAPCNEGNNHTGSADIPVTANIAGLSKGSAYHFRLMAKNGSEFLQKGKDFEFIAQDLPKVENEFVDEVNTDSTFVNATINPESGFTSVQIEYGLTTSYGSLAPEPPIELVSNTQVKDVRFQVGGLEPGTNYHYRVVATNLAGVTKSSSDLTFRTFDFSPILVDPCPNALARQQTGAALLLDCRGYELVSAANAGGYNVESDLILGQEPFAGYPRADDRVLYGMHNGGLTGVGSPTNFGVDPYVATRGNDGWSTQYVGIPADGTPSTAPFASPLSRSNSGLSTFAFGGENLCDPCFADGSTGIPVRMPDGSLIQGMRGSLDPGAGAEPSGYVGKSLSDDGNHLVFGSTSKFEPAGNNGSLTLYERDLSAGTTQVASTMPNGTTMTGTVAALDVSADGSRVLIGKLVGTDAAGNDYYDLYMHIGASPNSVEVADTESGVLFNGMTSDGSRVFFTTPDALAGDGDTSADLFRADVGSSSATVHRVSTGSSAGNTDACDPVGSSYNGENWNVVPGGPTDCSVVGLGGGAGVASESGTAFFLSPELLDAAAVSEGTEGEPNLYVAELGSAPHFVKTLEADNPLVMHSVSEARIRHTADFQTTPAGDASVFASTLPLTGYANEGYFEVFRYDTAADEVVCVSCAITNAPAKGDASLAPNGLSITDDGRVFFSSTDALVLRDTNRKKDAYQWSGPTEVQLISGGTGGFDSGLLSVTADGQDAYFFTRDTLAQSDGNGAVMKIYDARELGGFFVIPPPPGCAASDECHGPGTEAAPPAPIASLAGTPGNLSSTSDCGSLARRAKKNSNRAKQLRRKATRSSSRKQSRILRRRAMSSAKKARSLSKRAKACRRSSRGNG